MSVSLPPPALFLACYIHSNSGDWAQLSDEDLEAIPTLCHVRELLFSMCKVSCSSAYTHFHCNFECCPVNGIANMVI
jgi:hypothetical protein